MSSTPAHILVVDDVAANRLVLKRMLEIQGHTVGLAEHGAAALARLAAEPFDLILLDIMMPGLDGYEVLAALRADPELSRVPVVVVSAITDVESVARCVSLGALDYLFKPVNPTLLRARVDACLATKAMHDREREARQAIEAAQRTRSEYLSLVSHELRNPVTAIRGFADTLLRKSLAPEVQQDCLRSISRLALHIDALLSDMNDLSRIDSSQLRLAPAATPALRAAELAVRGVQSSVEARGQQLSLTIPPELPPLWADEMRLVQILSNLLNNASKYTGAGGTIRLAARAVDEAAVELSVADSGIGLSPDDQGRVFERFFRSSRPEAQRERGTGLGLFITRSLVEAQGGRIWLESALNVGTTVYFTLPMAPTLAGAKP